MPALTDPQHERYARERAEGKPKLKAFVEAGYAPHAGNATRLERRAEVRKRIHELLVEAAEFAGINRVRVLVELDRVGRCNLADFFEDDGKTLKNITTLPRAVSAALAAVEWDAEGHPKIKLHGRNEANITLLKHLGGLPEPETNREVNIFNVLSIEDQRTLAEALEALAAGAGGAGPAVAGERGASGEVP